MKTLILAAALLLPTLAHAQAPDPSMTCAAYIKQMDTAGPTPKTGDAEMDKMAAAMEKKVRTTCTTTPTMMAADAVMKAMTE